MKLKIEDFWDKWSNEEREAVCEYATYVANNFLNAYRLGSFQGSVLGVVAVSTIAFISYCLSVAKNEKFIQTAKDKGVVVTDSE